jgi:hypothetical protein
MEITGLLQCGRRNLRHNRSGSRVLLRRILPDRRFD